MIHFGTNFTLGVLREEIEMLYLKRLAIGIYIKRSTFLREILDPR